MLKSGHDYARFTRRLIQAGKQSDRQALRLLKRQVPEVVEQVVRDAKRGGPLGFWGRSLNRDEFAAQAIVPSLVLRILAELTGRSVADATPHAGLQHCYGYLFSNLETPYGFKRQRWIETGLEDSFGLHQSTLSPSPEAGTLLSNATFFSGLIAYRGNRYQLDRLRQNLSNRVASELARFALRNVTHFRLRERVQKSWRKKLHAWTLQTDVVTAEDGYSALIYSIRYHERRHELITLFPVDAATRKTICDRATGEKNKVVRTRYNAYLPALVGESVVGRISSREF